MIDFNVDFDILDYEEDEEFKNEELLNERDIKLDRELEVKAKERENVISEMSPKSFRDLLLKQELLRAISDCGFESPSEVQNECIPQAILGVDILCQAKSGMGKTCVFVLATLQQLSKCDEKVSVLIISHTRELAFQISREYERFSKYMSTNVAVFIGGISESMDEKVLKTNRPQVVVCTPGRLRSLIFKKKISLKSVKHFVIDECDKLLGMEDYMHDILYIARSLPKDKQVMMFSATMNEMVRRTANHFMNRPLEVIIGDDSKLILHGLQQFYINVDEKDKVRELFSILSSIEFMQTIIFTKTINRCTALNTILLKLNLSVICIHSAMAQESRLSGYQSIKNYKKRILVTTKMFDRGIDFERVNLVVNYDFPDNSDTYLHAVNRAGRFGTKGVAISFVSDYEGQRVRNEVQDRFNITLEKLPQNPKTGVKAENKAIKK